MGNPLGPIIFFFLMNIFHNLFAIYYSDERWTESSNSISRFTKRNHCCAQQYEKYAQLKTKADTKWRWDDNQWNTTFSQDCWNWTEQNFCLRFVYGCELHVKYTLCLYTNGVHVLRASSMQEMWGEKSSKRLQRHDQISAGTKWTSSSSCLNRVLRTASKLKSFEE